MNEIIMNVGLTSKIFGCDIAKVMGNVAKDEKTILRNTILSKETILKNINKKTPLHIEGSFSKN